MSLAGCKSRQVASPPPAAAPAASSGPCDELRRRLCDDFGAPSNECALAREQTRTLPAARCEGMLGRYPQAAAEARRFVRARQMLTAREQRTGYGEAPVLGAPGAPLTLVLFCDFRDPECGRGSGLANTIRNAYADRVRLVFRQFPRDADSRLLAQASLAAQAQGRFWSFYEVLYANPHEHDRAALERYARDAQLDLRRFRRALDEATYSADVEADVEMGRSLYITELPALFANGHPVSFPYGVAELESLITAATKG